MSFLIYVAYIAYVNALDNRTKEKGAKAYRHWPPPFLQISKREENAVGV